MNADWPVLFRSHLLHVMPLKELTEQFDPIMVLKAEREAAEEKQGRKEGAEWYIGRRFGYSALPSDT